MLSKIPEYREMNSVPYSQWHQEVLALNGGDFQFSDPILYGSLSVRLDKLYDKGLTPTEALRQVRGNLLEDVEKCPDLLLQFDFVRGLVPRDGSFKLSSQSSGRLRELHENGAFARSSCSWEEFHPILVPTAHSAPGGSLNSCTHDSSQTSSTEIVLVVVVVIALAVALAKLLTGSL